MKRTMVAILVGAVGLGGCAAMMHKPKVAVTSTALEETGVCATNVVKEASLFDPVVLKACAKGPDQLTVLFGTMHNETATPSNWQVRVWDPAGKLAVDADNLVGDVHIGQCGTGGCSKEALSGFKLSGPWAKGSYVIECKSKLPPVLKVIFQIDVI